MTLLDQICELRDQLNADKSPSNEQLKHAILALAEILETSLKNQSLFRDQVAAAVASLNQDVLALKKAQK